MSNSDATFIRTGTSSIARLELDHGIMLSLDEANLPFKIGRGADCDLSICDSHISRHHCELERVRGVLCLRDTSTNGTFVNGRKISDGTITLCGSLYLNFGGDVTLRITADGAGVETERQESGDRREADRRTMLDRRSNVVHVNFERRRDVRRIDMRRVGTRRVATA